MFRKIVSNLPFSPTLVGQLSFYARRLKKEETTRRAGLIVTALAFTFQSLAVFSPPEATNASTPGQVGSAPRCTVTAVGARGSAFEIKNNDKGVVTFDVTGGKKCKVQVSANSFYAPSMDGTPYNKQELYDRNTKTYDTPGRYTLQTAIPTTTNEARGCFYQLDLTYGTYNVTPVLAYAHGRIGNCGKTEFGSVSCSNLKVNKLSTTSHQLVGNATTVGSGTIKAYIFNVYRNGQLVATKRIDSDKKQASWTYDSSTPGSYTVKLSLKTNIGEIADTPGCSGVFTIDAPSPTPTASCTGVSALISDRVRVNLTGTAQATGSAKIQSYTFIVQNSLGVTVKTIPVTSSNFSAQASFDDITAAGDYTVKLVVQTSIGERSDPTNCVTKFTIAKPNVCAYNPSLPPNSPDCQPCPDDDSIWIKDERCKADVVFSKSATNVTQGNIDATSKTASESDKITYTLTAENRGKAPLDVTITDELADTLEYATLIDSGGGKLDKNTQIVTWPTSKLKAGEKTSRTIVVKLLKNIPTTNTGTTQKTSYDCKMTNTLGNTTDVKVKCPVEKVVVEQTVSELPKTGPGENMIFAGSLLAVVVYFYARSRQLGKEVRLVRRNVNAGTI